ncbi:hypothetical protein N9H45_02230 [Opitutales bacterium]|nr:hypothetical protein [Opitutales bacterium]
MVYATSPTPSFQTIKEKALSLLHSGNLKNSIFLNRKILVIGTDSAKLEESVPKDLNFDISYAPSVHFILRTGVFENFSFFVIQDHSFHPTFLDVEKLLHARVQKPIKVISFSNFKEMNEQTLENDFIDLETDTKIHYSINKSLKDDNFTRSHFQESENRINSYQLESELFQFLKSSLNENYDLPEHTIEKAIKIIRSSNKKL